MERTTKIPLFRRCVIQNFPFIEEDFDALTDYGLLCKVVEYLNKVINQTNLTSEQVEELSEAFNSLKSYVEHYFDNLDVQEEINNKLDAMAEAGTLADIISQYLNSIAVFAYDTVASMKTATNFVDGSYARTLGYYAKGDKGGALYRIRTITNDDTVDESLLIEITGDPTNTLVAELQLEDKMTVEQFGVKGDNTTDDTTKFQIALDNCKNLTCNNEQYKVVCVQFKENQTIDGQGAKLNCLLNTQALIAFDDYLTIKNLEIHSSNNDREWNRLDLRNHHHITFDGCTFSGFQQQAVVPPSVGLNVWALYIRECHDIRVINCNFVDNNFQDVLVEFDNYNIYFENCTGSYNDQDGFVVDIEPSQTNKPNENITFVNCTFRYFEIFEYFNEFNSNKNISIIDSTIDKFKYKGGDLSIINSPILSFDSTQAQDFLNGDGVLKIENSLAIGENLIKDKYIKDLSNNKNTLWKITYVSTSWSSVVHRIADVNGDYLALNKDNTAGVSIVIQSEPIVASAGDVFLIKQRSRMNFPDNAGGANAHHTRVYFFDNTDTQILDLKLRNNAGSLGASQEFSERSNIIMCPANTAYFKIGLRNGEIGSKARTDYQSFGVYKVNCSQDYRSNVETLDCGNGKPYIAKENPNTEKAQKINHFTGERCYYETPSTYIGAVCTDGENNTYKEFGALEE